MVMKISILLFCLLVTNLYEICTCENIFTSKRNENITNEKTSITLSYLELMNLLKSPLVKKDKIPNFLINRTFDFEVDASWVETINFKKKWAEFATRANNATSEFKIPKIDNGKVVNGLVDSVDAIRLQETFLSFFSKFKTREANSPMGRNASEGVFELWSEIIEITNDSDNYPVMKISREVAFNDVQIGDRQESIVVEICGDESEKEIIILGAHLDSANHEDKNATGIAPGIDDNVSGVSVLTEVLRSIVINEYHPRKTIRIIAFGAEEIGLRGSRILAEKQELNKEEKVLAMVNFDMVGYKGSRKDMYISTDYSNMNLAQFLRLLLNQYQPSVTHDFTTCRMCSDHVSWHAYGFPAVQVAEYESNHRNSTFNPNYHSSKDNYADGKVMSNYAKLALAFLAEVAKGDIKVDGET